MRCELVAESGVWRVIFMPWLQSNRAVLLSTLHTPLLTKQYNLWKESNQKEKDQLNDDKGNNPPVEVPGSDFGWGYALEVEQGKPEGRRQEGGLEVEAEQDSDPDEVDAVLMENGGHDRHDDKDDLDEVDEKADHENSGHNQEDKSPQGQVGVLDEFDEVAVTLHFTEYERKGGGAQEDEEYHTGQHGSFPHH